MENRERSEREEVERSEKEAEVQTDELAEIMDQCQQLENRFSTLTTIEERQSVIADLQWKKELVDEMVAREKLARGNSFIHSFRLTGDKYYTCNTNTEYNHIILACKAGIKTPKKYLHALF